MMCAKLRLLLGMKVLIASSIEVSVHGVVLRIICSINAKLWRLDVAPASCCSLSAIPLFGRIAAVHRFLMAFT